MTSQQTLADLSLASTESFFDDDEDFCLFLFVFGRLCANGSSSDDDSALILYSNTTVSSSASFLACNSRLRRALSRSHPPWRRFWGISILSGSVRLWHLKSCCMVLSPVMRGRPHGLLQSYGGRVDRTLLASVLVSIPAMCPKRVSRHDWTIAVSLVVPLASDLVISNNLVPFDI